MSPDESPKVVRVALNVTVPERFTVPVHIELGEDMTAAVVEGQMVDGRMHYRAIWFDGSKLTTQRNGRPLKSPDRPLTEAELDLVDWGQVAARAIYEAAMSLPANDELDADDVAEAADEQRSYNRLTYTDYERVLELAETGGPGAVSAEYHVGRRQANRYIRTAKGKVQR